MMTTNPVLSAGHASTSRESVTVIVSQVQGNPCFHFCRIPLLQGENCDLQWPFNMTLSLFENIEAVMTLNRVAHNVTRVEFLREQGQSRDYLITYNTLAENP